MTQDEVIPAGTLFEKYREHIGYVCLAGSKAYGLNTPESDTDLRGIFVAPTVEVLGLNSVPEQIEGEGDTTYWEVGKFIRLALNANPAILEALFSQQYILSDKSLIPLIQNKKAFLSQRCFKTYKGYASAQFNKFAKSHATKGQINWKNIMHTVRLLQSGLYALRHGEVLVMIPEEERDFLRNIRRGQYGYDYLYSFYQSLEQEYDHALLKTDLPVLPNFALANDILVDIRRTHLV